MGVRAVENLRRQTGCDLRKCVAVVFAGSSLIHGYIARRFLGEEQAQRENFRAVGRELVERLGIPLVRVFAINWGCSGYSKAMEIAARYVARRPRLRQDQFVLVVTVNRTSKIPRLRLQGDRPDFRRFCPGITPRGGRKPPVPDETSLGLRRRRAATG